MAEIVTIARPYAEAVFRLARQHRQLDAWSEMLELAATVAADPSMRQCITDPNLTAKQVEALFLGVCDRRLDDAGKNFIRVLVHNHRLEALPAISELYQQLKAREEGVLEATVVSAFLLTDEQLRRLVSQMEERFQRKVNARVTVDPGLIGGVRVEIGDEVLDASVRGKLQAMAFALTH